MIAALAFVLAASDFTPAYHALEEWQLPQARTAAEQAISQEPHDGETLALASRVQFYRGEYSSAASLYAAAIEAGARPDPGYAHVLLDTYRLTRGYLEKQSAHFRVSYPPGKDDLFADEVLPVLEAAYATIAQDLGLTNDPGDKIAVLVVPDAEGLAAVSTLTTNEIENSGTIAICKFNRLMVTSPLATVQGYDWADTLAHEYTHLVINLVSHARVPIWLHEGIAKFMETRWDGAPGRALTPASVNLLAKAAKDNSFIPFERMHPSMAKLPTQEQSGLAFAEVFVAIKMLQDKRGTPALRDALVKIGSGTGVEEAVAQVYGKSFPAFLDDWRAQLKTYKGKVLVGAQIDKIALKKDKAEHDVSELEPIQEKQVKDFARLGELLHLRGRTKAAVVEYARAYSLSGVRYPSLLNKYAMALAQNGDNDKAEALLKELLVPHPTYTPARLTLARLAMTRGETALAKSQYLAAMYENPFIPEIYAAQLKLDKNDEVADRHFTESLGKALPAAKPEPQGPNKLTVLYAPFGRARLPDGSEVAYPAVGIATGALQEVELVTREGKTKTVAVKTSGAFLEATGAVSN